jgi:hypothetical protein
MALITVSRELLARRKQPRPWPTSHPESCVGMLDGNIAVADPQACGFRYVLQPFNHLLELSRPSREKYFVALSSFHWYPKLILFSRSSVLTSR